MARAFVDFYSGNNISPFGQDLSNLKQHFFRRSFLTQSLSIIPHFFKNKSFLEFGPGSGQNSLYLLSLKPSLFHLVEANEIGIKETEKILAVSKNKNIKIFKNLFLEFQTTDRYDLVWAESCVPHQNDPIATAQHMAKFTQERSGIIVFSCASGISYLPEIMRRIFKHQILKDKDYTLENSVSTISPFMKNHLSNLKNMTRYTDDWIMDNLFQPFHFSKLFNIPDAINALMDSHNVLATQPRFITDWRWYKEVNTSKTSFNEVALSSYYKTNLNLMHHNYSNYFHSEEFGKKLEELGSTCWDLLCRLEDGTDKNLEKLNHHISRLIQHLSFESKEIAKTVEYTLEIVNNPSLDIKNDLFAQWWGRGQQYISLISK